MVRLDLFNEVLIRTSSKYSIKTICIYILRKVTFLSTLNGLRLLYYLACVSRCGSSVLHIYCICRLARLATAVEIAYCLRHQTQPSYYIIQLHKFYSLRFRHFVCVSRIFWWKYMSIAFERWICTREQRKNIYTASIEWNGLTTTGNLIWIYIGGDWIWSCASPPAQCANNNAPCNNMFSIFFSFSSATGKTIPPPLVECSFLLSTSNNDERVFV